MKTLGLVNGLNEVSATVSLVIASKRTFKLGTKFSEVLHSEPLYKRILTETEKKME